MRFIAFFKATAACLVLMTATSPAMAWGAAGHRVIGQAAAGMLDPTARAGLDAILEDRPGNSGRGGHENTQEADLAHACNWPDTIRTQAGWKWSAPLHYVNMPRGVAEYNRQRDCPDGMCVTEGIRKYANELTLPELDAKRRWQAFAFLCHLVADLHQPLHAGFRDDRGGNYVSVEFEGKEWKLHQFWDSVLAAERLHDEASLVERISRAGNKSATQAWNPAEVSGWTEASHRLAESSAYPGTRSIDPSFADESWRITRNQWQHAATRLARILNAVIGEGSVQTNR